MHFEFINGLLAIKTTAVTTAALAAILLLIGYFVRDKIPFLAKYCIPAPVIGGFIFMFITFFGHTTNTFQFDFDKTFQSPFMLAFFTTVGLGASMDLLKKGGKLLIIYWLCTCIISVFQNLIGVSIAKVIGLEDAYALLASAIAMVGGHGSAASYGQTFTGMGYTAAMEVGAAAATFGLIASVIIGGPLARRLIVKHNLHPEEEHFSTDVEQVNVASNESLSVLDIIKNVTAILICMAIGMMIADGITILIDMWFPAYVGAMFVAVIVRNLNEKYHFYNFNFGLVERIGDVTLALFLSIALMTLKLWQLAGLIGGVFIVVTVQVIFLALVAYFIVFRILGKHYDAAVMCAGLCGHGLGATPTAVVNMTAVKEEYGMSRRAFMIVPIVGAFLVDLVYHPQTIAFVKFFVSNAAN